MNRRDLLRRAGVAGLSSIMPPLLKACKDNSSLYSARGQNTSVASNAADSVYGSPSGDVAIRFSR